MKTWMPALIFVLLAAGAAGGAVANHGSVGLGRGNDLPPREAPAGDRSLHMNYDGSAENGYCWDDGGIAPPYYGAFAECYSGINMVGGIELKLSGLGYPCRPCDLYVWSDAGGVPGSVLFVYTGANPCPVATWPDVSTHDFTITGPYVNAPVWVGYWADFSNQPCGYFVAADLDGPGGCPFTNIAPGIGYPTGWQNTSIIWGPTQAIGIGLWDSAPPPATGACCLEDGYCVLAYPGFCQGEYMGNGTVCDPNPCPQPPQGACCGPDGICVFTSQTDCFTGDWRLDVPCDPNPCPPAPPVPSCVRYGDYIHWVGGVHVSRSAYRLAASVGRAYLADGPAGLQVIDIAVPSAPRILATLNTPGTAKAVALSGTLACVADSTSLLVVNISDPSHPVIQGHVNMSPSAEGVAVSGNCAYVTSDGYDRLSVVDISNPSAPAIVARVQTGIGYDVAVSGSHAWVASETGLVVVEIADPLHPVVVGSLPAPGPAGAVAVQGELVYLAIGAYGLQVIDVGDPRNPQLAAEVVTSRPALSVAAGGTRAYVGEGEGDQGVCEVIDVSSPQNPRVVGVATVYGDVLGTGLAGGFLCASFHHLGPNGGYGDGVSLIEVAGPMNPPVVGYLDAPGYTVRDLAVSGSYAYGLERRWAVGDNLFAVVDVGDPENPRPAGALDLTGMIGDLAVSGSYAFVTEAWMIHDHEGKALVIIDVSQPSNPRIVSSVYLPFTPNASPLALSGRYAYLADFYYEGRISVIDVSDPLNPVIVADAPGGGGTTALAASGTHLYAVDYYVGFKVIDISDPLHAQLVGNLILPETPISVTVTGSHAYVGTASSGLLVIDVSDPLDPRLVGRLPLADGIEDVVVSGSHAYASSSAAGMLVVDVSNPAQPVLLGGAARYGAWATAVSGGYVHVGGEGLQILPIQCEPAAVGDEAGAAFSSDVQVFPNPISRQATIRLMIPGPESARAGVFNVAGRRIRSVFDGVLPAGTNRLVWDGRDDAGREVASGVYLVRVSAGEKSWSRPIVVLR